MTAAADPLVAFGRPHDVASPISDRNGAFVEQVEVVALWLGLIASIVGVVLALVSIMFTRAVEQRASELNLQIVQTLQKIETAVDRSTDDTSNLIKVAWDRLLPESGARTEDDRSDPDPEFAKQVAAGVAAELRSELTADTTSSQTEVGLSEQENRLLARWQEAFEKQLVSGVSASSQQDLNQVYETISKLPSTPFYLLKSIASGAHLTRTQYMRLADGPLGRAILKLRDSGLLVPLVPASGSDSLVYWLPAPSAGRIRGVLELLSDRTPPGSIARHIDAELRKVGYLNDESSNSGANS